MMVSRAVGAERWAITKHPDGSLTGNVFHTTWGDDGTDASHRFEALSVARRDSNTRHY